MPDRLSELQRQRALMQEHLAWLDREIAAESGGRRPPDELPATGRADRPGLRSPDEARLGPPPQPSVAQPSVLRQTLPVSPGVPFPASSSLSTPPTAPADADAIMAQYAPGEKSLKDDVRKGCFFYLALAFALVGLGLLALYLYHRSLH